MDLGIENKKYHYKLSVLNAIKFKMEISMDSCFIFVNEFEKYLNDIKTQFEKKIINDPARQSLNEQEFGQYYTQMFSIEHSVISELYRQHAYALCMTLNSYLEAQLVEITNVVSAHRSAKLSLDDIKAENDLLRFWKYLTKVHNFRLNEIEPIFMELLLDKKLRNTITHRDGYLKNSELKYFTKTAVKILINQESVARFDLSKDYLLKLHQRVRLFLTFLLDKLDEQFST